ncbi:MAG: TIGR03118 family protein [Acidobacteriia bacterium]|nr:TIGR03118 family protein [Terriglobia bacterium]
MRKFILGLAVVAAAATPSGKLLADVFGQTNLVSDVPGLAPVTDPNLVNPWGVSFSATSPFWLSNQGSDTSTLYNGAGAKQALTVTVPPASPQPAGPTGQVFAGIPSNFLLNGTPSTFIFDTLSGTVDAWNGGGAATAVAGTSGSVYTGLALANNGRGNFLYAADFAPGGGIQVFDSTFASTTLSGSFTDPSPISGYEPYNIQTIGTSLYVEYAELGSSGRPVFGSGLGYVDVYDLNGNFTRRLITGGQLDVPWGITIAPSGFGSFSNDLLVGNFGNGEINAYDPVSGAFMGTITDASGNPIVNSGLWALEVRSNGGSGSDPNAVYFTAGINGQTHGLFGKIDVAPEPSTWSLAAAGFLALGALGLRRSSKKRA